MQSIIRIFQLISKQPYKVTAITLDGNTWFRVTCQGHKYVCVLWLGKSGITDD